MVVDFAIDMERAGNTTPAEAAVKGGLIRFRPTMMTTMAAIMGTLPIVLGTGAGASARQPLGLSVVGGLVFAQIVTLYLTPIFYTYMDSFQARLSRRWHKDSGRERLALGHEPLLAQAERVAQNTQGLIRSVTFSDG